MSTYVVTSSNYRDPAFWNSISETSPGHTLDFSGLPSDFKVSVDSDTHTISIWNGRSFYSVGERGNGSSSFEFGGATRLEHFTTVTGHDGIDYVEGTDSDDTITGGGGNDTLSGDQGVDTVEGGAGHDVVVGGSGNDSLLGGDGQDTLLGDNTWMDVTKLASDRGVTPTALTVENEAGGPIELWRIDGNGQLVKQATIADGQSLTLNTYSEYNWVLRDENGKYLDYIEGEANQTETYGDEGLDDTIYGGTGDDSIYGMFGDDYLSGDGGEDTISGGYGDDTIYGGSSDDSVSGDAGNDYISGGTGYDTLRGGAGNDTLLGSNDGALIYGDAGDDVMYTGEGASTAYGGTGADTLYTDDGADRLEGNDDADTFRVNTNWGSFDGVTIVGGEGGTDQDVIDASLMGSGVSVELTAEEAGTLSLGAETLTFSEIEDFVLSDHDDIFDAAATSGGVRVDAGDGNDTLKGGTGNDDLTGGAGDDTYVFDHNSGLDTIRGFDTSDDDSNGYFNDQLDVSDLRGGSGPNGAVSNADVVVSDDGAGNAVLTFPEGEQVVLDGIAPDGINSLPQLYAAGIPCFTEGALIATERGCIPVQDLRVGDRLQTADNGLQPILWLGRRDLSRADLKRQPHLAPVEIIPGGIIATARPMRVSPQHRFVVTSQHLAQLGGTEARGQGEAFVRARLLESWDAAHAQSAWDGGPVSYFHVMTERHEVIFADGVATETFWPGPEALRSLTHADRAELVALFPGLAYAWHLLAERGRAHVASHYSALARYDLRRRELPHAGRPKPLVHIPPLHGQRYRKRIA